ncbi:DUF5681 domain-containing protein [Qipengyuania oceanensis]|uniref:DUF5681 domain-containing protein n=1 Tax=Qipengyuania oceanensis TaxID=1463597 RepID=A0A844YIJ1_9SPHN|nr:DUF5681 domain-containing protein [Qipengyuania oceanensis]MXO63951.1 hypothetical protein [Qipengyuania oceanensis]
MANTGKNSGSGGPGGGDYEVGYGKPPKHSRWAKGQSGNPKGRKKGSRGLKQDLDQALKERITINVNGKHRKDTTQAHAMLTLALRAASGDMRANRQLTDLVLAIFGPGDRGAGEEKLSPLDKQLLDRWLERQGSGGPDISSETSSEDTAPKQLEDLDDSGGDK